MENITELKRGSLNGLRRQTNECLVSAYYKGYADGKNEPNEEQEEYIRNLINKAKQEGYDIGLEEGKKRAISEDKENEMYNKGIEDASNLIAFVSKDFIQECFPNEKDWDLYDLNAKYGLTVVIKEFKKWQEQGLGLYFWSGIRGTGKTYLASCVCNELMARYHMVTKFVSASDLINLDQEGKKNNYEKNPIDVLSECMLLVIDDLGQQKTGEAYLDDILFRIIDHRYQNKLVTMITSNIELKKLRLDDRVSDRLNKMCQPIPLPDISFRQKESNQNKRDFFKDMGLM